MQPTDDLEDFVARKEAADKALKEAEAKKQAQAAMERAIAWDRAMQRAFKGIVSRPTRHRMMMHRSPKGDD